MLDFLPKVVPKTAIKTLKNKIIIRVTINRDIISNFTNSIIIVIIQRNMLVRNWTIFPRFLVFSLKPINKIRQ